MEASAFGALSLAPCLAFQWITQQVNSQLRMEIQDGSGLLGSKFSKVPSHPCPNWQQIWERPGGNMFGPELSSFGKRCV